MTIALLLVIAASVVLVWRNVLTGKRERRAVLFGFKEIVLALSVAILAIGLLVYSAMNFTWKIV